MNFISTYLVKRMNKDSLKYLYPTRCVLYVQYSWTPKSQERYIYGDDRIVLVGGDRGPHLPSETGGDSSVNKSAVE
jgi:hypothetical protein